MEFIKLDEKTSIAISSITLMKKEEVQGMGNESHTVLVFHTSNGLKYSLSSSWEQIKPEGSNYQLENNEYLVTDERLEAIVTLLNSMTMN